MGIVTIGYNMLSVDDNVDVCFNAAEKVAIEINYNVDNVTS